VVLLEANVVKSVSASLVERNSAVIIASKVAVAVESVAETIETKTSAAMTTAQESDATIEVMISEVVTIAVHADVMTALRLIQIVLAHEEGMVDQEAKTGIDRKVNQAKNATRSTKLSCILGI